MRAVLFGDRVDDCEQKMQENGRYEIIDAPVVASSTPWKSAENELNYQLHLSEEVMIRSLSGSPIMRRTTYQSIAEIRAIGLGPMDVDVLGVVLHVGNELKTVTTSRRLTSTVREVILTDPSCDEPLFVSVLDEMARKGCPAVSLSAPDFIVVSFTGMLTTGYKGLSLTTSMTTTVNQHPVGNIPDSMRKWANENKILLSIRRNKLLSWLGLPVIGIFETVLNLKMRTVLNTRTGDRFWLKAVFPYVQMDHVKSYVGCANCEGPTTNCVASVFHCNFCFQQFSQARMCLSFTGLVEENDVVVPITARTEHTGLIFRTSVLEIMRIIDQRDMFGFDRISMHLRTIPSYVQVAASVEESYYPCLEWKVVQVEISNTQGRNDGAGPSHSASSSCTTPHLPDSIVKSVAGLDDVHAAYIDSSTPYAFI